MSRRLADVFAVRRVCPVAGVVHAVDVGARFTFHHPFRQRLADPAALQEARHDPAGKPVVLLAAYRPHQRVAVGREGEGTIDPAPDADAVEHRKAIEGKGQFIRDAVNILLDQVEAIVPGRPIHVPVPVAALIDAKQHALLFLAHIGEAFEIDDEGNFLLELDQIRDRLSDEVVMLHGRDRQLEPHHAPDLLGPQASGIHHMIGTDRAFLGHHLPCPIGLLVQFRHAIVLDNRRTAQFRRLGIGVNSSRWINVTLARRVEAAQHAIDIHDGTGGFHLLRGHQPDILDAHGLEHTIGRLQPLPALRGGRHRIAAGHVHADALPGLLLDLAQEIDGIGLQCRDVGIGIEGMKAPCRMPARPRGEDIALDEQRIGPAHLGQVIEH